MRWTSALFRLRCVNSWWNRRQVSMEDEPDGANGKMATPRSEWRGLIEMVIGTALIAVIFLLAIFVALAN